MTKSKMRAIFIVFVIGFFIFITAEYYKLSASGITTDALKVLAPKLFLMLSVGFLLYRRKRALDQNLRGQ